MTEVWDCISVLFDCSIWRLVLWTLQVINMLVALDMEGDRLFAKYYDGRKKAEQIANEAMLYKKTKAVSAKSEGTQRVIYSFMNFNLWPFLFYVDTAAEVLLLDHEVIVFKSGIECKFFISGPLEEVSFLRALSCFLSLINVSS